METVEDSPGADVDWRTRSATYVTILEALSTEPRDRAEVCSLTDVPRATCDRLLEDAEGKGWIESDGSRYHVRPIGEVMAAHLAALLGFFETLSRDRATIADYAERVDAIEAAIDDVREPNAEHSHRIARLERRFDGTAEHEAVERMREAIDEHGEVFEETRERTDETARTLEAIDERLDRVEEQLRATRTAVTETETHNEELRTELATVREIAEYAAERTNRGWVDRLSGR